MYSFSLNIRNVKLQVFIFSKERKKTNKKIKASDPLTYLPVISVVSSTKNEFVVVQEDVTLYGHCSKHLKYSERKHYVKMLDFQMVNIIFFISRFYLMKKLVIVSRIAIYTENILKNTKPHSTIPIQYHSS